MNIRETLEAIASFLRRGHQSGNTTAALEGVRHAQVAPHGQWEPPRLVLPTEQDARNAAMYLGVRAMALSDSHRFRMANPGPVVFDSYTVEFLANETLKLVNSLEGEAKKLWAERDQLRAEVERLKAESTVAAVSVLVDHARGVLMHRYEGACPDSVEGPDVRDPECPVCRAIDSASRLRTIGPGEVVVSEKELNVLLILERYARKHGPESIDYAIEALDALRSQKEGGAT